MTRTAKGRRGMQVQYNKVWRCLRRLSVLFLLWVPVSSVHLQAQELEQADEYTLNAGDSIRIYAYGEPDLTFERLLIGQRGRISYPFLGELKVEGLTINDVQNLLTDGLKPDYLVDPRVSVSIVEYRSFFVNGEVKNPGALDFQPGLTLRKAISLAGGFTARANKKEMLVIADNAAGDDGQRVDLDYRIRPGDIITVKDTFF